MNVYGDSVDKGIECFEFWERGYEVGCFDFFNKVLDVFVICDVFICGEWDFEYGVDVVF